MTQWQEAHWRLAQRDPATHALIQSYWYWWLLKAIRVGGC